MNLFDIYHQQTKCLKESILVEERSDSGSLSYTKTYPRFEIVELPQPSSLTQSLSECILSCSLDKSFKCNVTLEQISTLLYFSIGANDSEFDNNGERRMYPSAGSLYPLEFYLLNFKDIDGLPTGIYHYNLERHGLTIIEKRSFTKGDRVQISPESVTLEAQFALLGTAILSRSVENHGERAYRDANLELGAVSHNLSLCAASLEISAINVREIYDEEVESLLSIDGMSEKFLNSVFFG